MINQEMVHQVISKIAFFLAYLLAMGPVGFFKVWTSFALGDDTAKEEGLLTLNPAAHMDVWGFLALMILGIGWFRNIPINPANISGPWRKLKLFTAYYADVFLHILLASVALFMRSMVPVYLQKFSLTHWMSSAWYGTTITMIDAFFALNVYLTVFGAVFNGITYLLVLLGEEEDFEYKEYIFYASFILPFVIFWFFGEQLQHVFFLLIFKIHDMFVWLLS